MQTTMKAGLLHSIGENASTMDEVFEMVEGFKGSDFQDQAVAAQAFLNAKKARTVNPIEKRMSEMSDGEIYDVLLGLKDRVDDAADLAFNIGLDLLMLRLPEDKFFGVLNRLDAQTVGGY